MAINGISGKSVACLLLYCMGRLDFAVDANVLRVMTRLGWLKHIGASPADALATCDRRVATEHGLLQAPRAPPRLPLPKRPYLTSVGGEAMPKLPKLVYGATVDVALSVGAGGAVRVLLLRRRLSPLTAVAPPSKALKLTPPSMLPSLPPPKRPVAALGLG